MARSPQPKWWIYKEQMDFFCNGDALWQPAPTGYTRIAIGDVGFIRRERFHLLFSAGSPLGDPRRGEDVPMTFEELNVGTLVRDEPRRSGCLCTGAVRAVGAGAGAAVSTNLPLEVGANFSFELTGNRGAALVTKYSTYMEDFLSELAFERYTKRHYKSWVEFAQHKEYGIDVQPVLVSGIDMTKDFEMVAYSYEDISLDSGLTVAAPMLISASGSIRGTWYTRYTPHTNSGPQNCAPPLSEQAMDSPLSQPGEAGVIPSGFNQCVFVRYYTMRPRVPLGLFPKVIRAGAGPHDLGPGDNTGGAFPELTVQPDTELMDDASLEPNVVVRNTPSDKEYDSWGAIADYVFENSNADFVLMHHRDLVGIRAAGDTEHLPGLLARCRPRIVVSASGVGRIDCRGIQWPKMPANQPETSTPRTTNVASGVPSSYSSGLAGSSPPDHTRPVTLPIPFSPSRNLPSVPVLQQLESLDRSSPDFHDQLRDVLYRNEYVLLDIQGGGLLWLVDYLDKTLDALSPSSPAFQKCLPQLKNICGNKEILPSSYTIPSHLFTVHPDSFVSGGYCDVYEGTLDGSKVCVERVRMYAQEAPPKFIKTLFQEGVTWKFLTHPNILRILGITTTPIQLVSNWMAGGDLPGFIRRNPNADPLGLLCDIAKGLSYLCSCNVIHGDLKGANILVDDSGHALVTGFALSKLTRRPGFMEGIEPLPDPDPRWTAPEILDGGNHSWNADIFAFAMIMVEAFTGAVPFADVTSVTVSQLLMQGTRPQRPTHPAFTDDLWTLMRLCWHDNPYERLVAPQVSKILVQSVCERLISHPPVTREHIRLITTIFSDSDQVKTVHDATWKDSQTFVDVLEEALDDLAPEIHERCLHFLYKICGSKGLLPRSLMIPLCYNPMENPLRRGEFMDVWKGQHQGREVAAKVLKVFITDDLWEIKTRFCREVMSWKSLHHPNVLSLLGVTMAENRFVMVSEWMANGNINEFVKKHTEANRLALLEDATRGLIYMHERGVIHGNLRGSNILVDNDGRARLADFSLFTILSDKLTITTIARGVTTAQWMGPELLDRDKFDFKDSRPTRESDCYALGMTIYEVLSGQAPFAQYSSHTAIWKILVGGRPQRPEGEQGGLFTDNIWNLLDLCWKPQPGDRIDAKSIFLGLERNSLLSTSPPKVRGEIGPDSWRHLDTTFVDSRNPKRR